MENKSHDSHDEMSARVSESKGYYWHMPGDVANSLNPFGDKKVSAKNPPKDSAAKDSGSPVDKSDAQSPRSRGPIRTISHAASGAAVGVGTATIRSVKGVIGAVKYLNPMACDSDDDESVSAEDRNQVEHPEKKEVLQKKETALAIMLRNARNKYVEKGLVGKIIIHILYGVITSGEFCIVNKADTIEPVDVDELKQLGALNYKATSAMDAILANLSRRSKQYSRADLRADVTLTQGVVFGISVPFFMSLGFQTQIQFEVTAASLVDYRKRKEKLRAFQKELKTIPNAAKLINEVISGGFSVETAQRAVVATNGAGDYEALRWAAKNDILYAIADQMHAPEMVSAPCWLVCEFGKHRIQ